jgi:murein DD-endopeptidase MepM/ murein hydrolase activator NlpD
MRSASRKYLSACACCVLLTWQSSASAEQSALPSSRSLTDDSEELSAESGPKIRLDKSGKPAYLARFSDGPRRVPEPHGPAKELADRLGIGSAEVARRLLQARPSAELVSAVPGEAPKTLLWPVVQGRFGRGFGFTRRARPELKHNGVDIGAPEGTVVRAAADGLVVYSDNGLMGYGNCVLILHPNGMLTLYAHNFANTVQPGWIVQRGEQIALLGQTGYAWGPHLHFELRHNGHLRDPMSLFRGKGSDEVTGPLVQLDVWQQLPPSTLAMSAQVPTIPGTRNDSVIRARSLLPSAATRTPRASRPRLSP